ncbi:MAG: GNAT family N-acetyltransferase [Cyclobacteriaceae bacterium]|nr:GNAT family N-acetyltransferase [Cyclobacteriaceae bacterium]
MSTIHIKLFKELTLRELYSFLKLRTDIFVVEQNCPYPELDGADEKAIHLYIKEDDTVIAYLRIIPSKTGTARIGRVVTKIEHRGKGLSSQLMKRAMEYIREHYPEDTMILSAQEHLQDYYGSFGFKAVSEVYLEDGIPHVDMEYKK